jgi:hypothetical protein
MRELAARASFAGCPLPPSYVAAMRACASCGGPEELLSAAEMGAALRVMMGTSAAPPSGSPVAPSVAPSVAADIDASKRYLPFARAKGSTYYCFDTKRGAAEPTTPSWEGELTVVEWTHGEVRAVASHFGQWLDEVADRREESVERAAEIPKSLRDLLLQLGFRFDDPIVGRLSTGDVSAIVDLVGDGRAREIRGDSGRLFDASGKAHLVLNLDEFALTCTLRTGTLVFEAEEVFRWLRTFRDESFFGDAYREPSHPDRVRDLRKAPREAPLVLRGTLDVATLPAQKHFFAAASGVSPDDFHVLARGAGESRATSVFLHLVKGDVRGAHTLEQPLHHLYAADDGTVWGLSNYGAVVRLRHGRMDSFPLPRAAGNLTWWYGIGEAAGRVVVWGTGSLLEFDGTGFVPFSPEPGLERHEAVTAVAEFGGELRMLVCGEGVGAVARFDGDRWAPIAESDVIDGDMVDMDMWRGVGILLTRAGDVYRFERQASPRPIPWDMQEPAYFTDDGALRPCHGVRGIDGGALIASVGGVIVVGGAEPTFHGAAGSEEPVRLCRVGRELPTSVGAMPTSTRDGSGSHGREIRPAPGESSAIVATFGPHVWLWTGQAFRVLDMRGW